jgi:ABC-type antimicrobial peptide transport system permease subunit
MAVTEEFGKTISWQLLGGRDFSTQLATDSNSLVINETASKLIGFKDPVGKTVQLYGKNYTVIGVVKDLLMESPFSIVTPTIFMQDKLALNVMTVKMNPSKSVSESLSRIEAVFQKYNSSAPFDYKFVDDVYAVKFSDEVRISKLASFFATLAIFISCLGLFGLASFVAEQRKKEIGVRKVIGASVFNLWKLLSKDFVMLVLISLLIASPLAYYFMHQWIQSYTYQAEISWWIFAIAGAGALIITLITVSFQAIKAAVANPVKSLRTE